MKPLFMDELLAEVAQAYNTQVASQSLFEPRVSIGERRGTLSLGPSRKAPPPLLSTVDIVSTISLSTGYYDCECCSYDREIHVVRKQGGDYAIVQHDAFCSAPAEVVEDDMDSWDLEKITAAFHLVACLNNPPA